MLLLFLACGEVEEAPASAPLAADTKADKAPASTPEPQVHGLERSPPLEALVATSGEGAEQLFDANPKTGWSPAGDPASEGVLLRLPKEHDQGVEGMEVQLCPDSAKAQLQIYANGTIVGNLRLGPGEGDEVRFEPASTRSLFVKVRSAEGRVCVGEVGLLIDGEGRIPEPPRAVAGTVSVSSQLQPDDAYHPDYLFDSRDDFGWVEGADGPGKGQSVTVRFEQSQTLTGLRLWNGYQRSQDHFDKNARVGAISVYDAGKPVHVDLLVDDVMGPQDLVFPAPLSTRDLMIEITDVVPGSKYQDLVISELRFLNDDGHFGLETEDAARAKELKGEIAGGPLAELLDTRYHSACEGPYIGSRELKLRSNHSFVWYDESEDLNEVFDGAWVPTKADEFKLYGRIHRVQTVYVAYGQGETSDTTRIGGGTVKLTRAADLDQKAWDDRVDQLQKGPASVRFECAPTHADAVKQGLVLVEGKPFVDLLVPG